MKSLRIAFICAVLITFFLLGFGLYQHFGLGNKNILLSLDRFSDNRFFSATLLLGLVFTFIMGLVSFIPAVIGALSSWNQLSLSVPLIISILNIALCLFILLQYIVPTINNQQSTLNKKIKRTHDS